MTQAPRSSRFPLMLDGLTGRGPGSEERTSLNRPQRPLHEAARDGSRQVAPAGGLGLDSEAVRRRMVQRLRADGLNCGPVANAFQTVPRHRFIDTALVQQAYEDTALPIGLGQTISKPSVVARMLSLLFETEGARQRGSLGRVLEIGTGCGYQTALLSRVATRVLSIERLQPLYEKAVVNLADWRAEQRIRLVWGDGCFGHPPLAPYDSIVAAAGGEALPQAWIDQLAVGGRLVAPVHDVSGGRQSLLVVDRHAGGLTQQRLDGVIFVPLKSGIA